jgi:hypothetical protein
MNVLPIQESANPLNFDGNIDERPIRCKPVGRNSLDSPGGYGDRVVLRAAWNRPGGFRGRSGEATPRRYSRAAASKHRSKHPPGVQGSILGSPPVAYGLPL